LYLQILKGVTDWPFFRIVDQSFDRIAAGQSTVVQLIANDDKKPKEMKTHREQLRERGVENWSNHDCPNLARNA
jgi:hypothetical protein